ncbi:hypothetical protein EON81_19950 [bacterium]|nr:MAG: hypothetical protein EON81_19950 [bacterium]
MLPLLLGLAMTQNPRPQDPGQNQERTVFQTHAPYSDRINLRADVAIVYGFEADMPERVKSWRDRGYKVHLMTGVAWGSYQDYYYGRWDGKNHEDEAQTRANGEKIGHGGDVYYMSPGKDYGKYLAEGVRRALNVGVEAVHLEEPEFWSWGGYGEGFKREWQEYYKEPWQDATSSPDARWRTAKLMYFLYRRALQQVFDDVQAFNKETGKHVRCYVPTHSLLNYADWGIVSPQQSLAELNGCDGYIAQVWTGTAREPNVYRGVKKERTFETAFLEYGSMQNLVRSTGRSVWYLADPIEDNPNHDWGDYQRNYRSTLVASLLQPEVAQYEVMPWPERIFNGDYPSETQKDKRVPIPDTYETELQVVINALKDMKQKDVRWESGSHGIGVLISDSLMFQRGGPNSSDDDFGHVYGLALPFLKRGMPIQPVQLENVNLKGYLNGLKVLLISYEGQKPLKPAVHDALAKWVKAGGTLAFVDNDNDPFKGVREWWNENGMSYATPREHLFEKLGVGRTPGEVSTVGKGRLIYLTKSPNADISRQADGSQWLADKIRTLAPDFAWKESSAVVLRRGPYVVAAGMDESDSPQQTIRGEYVDLFDAKLAVQKDIVLKPETRHLLVDLSKFKRPVLASAGYVHQTQATPKGWKGTVEGIGDTASVILLRTAGTPKSVTLDGQPLTDQTYDAARKLLWLRFPNKSEPQKVEVNY